MAQNPDAYSQNGVVSRNSIFEKTAKLNRLKRPDVLRPGREIVVESRNTVEEKPLARSSDPEAETSPQNFLFLILY